MAFLVGMSESIKGKHFELNKDRTTLGRNSANDVVVDDPTISSQHCYIARRGDRFVLHDLNSTNGTRLNFQPIKEAELKPKQVIQLGAIELMFDGDESAGKEPNAVMTTQVIVDAAPPVTAPKSFSSVSPFGTRRKESRGFWLVFLIIVGLMAFAGLAFVILKLLNLGEG